jgi:hypothetical protein
LSGDNLSTYDFKVDITRDGTTFKILTSDLVFGAGFASHERTRYGGELSSVKVRSILASKITQL